MKIAIVTDSTSDLPPEVAAEYGIEVVPNLLTIDNVSYLDGSGLGRETIYARVTQNRRPPTTAAPSPEVYTLVYQKEFETGADVILSFHPASRLSALISVASLAAKAWPDKIHIIDSNNASLGLGFQVLYAARSAAAGESLERIKAENTTLQEKVRVFALLDTLSFVHHSGRVSWVSASLGSMLGLKAVIELRKGVVHRLGLTRSREKGLSILKQVAMSAGAIREAAILHTTTLLEEEARFLIKDIQEQSESVMKVLITPIIGSHVGPGCLGIALVLD